VHAAPTAETQDLLMQDCNLGDNAFVTTLTAVMERDRAASLVVLEVITITVDLTGVFLCTTLKNRTLLELPAVHLH